VIVGLLAAIGASVGYGVATVLQALGARRSTGLSALRQPAVLAGFALDGVSFLVSLVAFARLPLFLVETVIAASLVVVVLLAHPVLHTPLRAIDLVASAVVIGGLVVLAGAGGSQPAVSASRTVERWVFVALGLLVVGTAAAYRRAPAWVMGLASGLGYAGAAVGVRAARTTGTPLELLWQPMALVVALSGLVAVVAYVRALERGPASLAASLVSVGEVVVPGAVGLAVLGDSVRAGWALPAALATAVALGGCLVLARAPGNEAEQQHARS
jgi:drug/metabolite transporter (DMT)-like permease